MNKDIMRSLGFGEEMAKVEAGLCPFCNRPIHPNVEFRDDSSRREYEVSGLCQACQDRMFGKEEG